MQRKDKSLWYLIALASLLFCTIIEATAQTSSEVAEKALDSLVVLEVEVEDKGRKRLIPGSGFFVRQNRIATCLHVIEGATKGTAKLVKTGQKFHIEGVIASDKKYDLVLLKVSDFGASTLSLGNSDAVQVGEAIQVAGNPQLILAGKPTLLEGTIIPGIISSTREGDDDEFFKYLRDNMGISPNKVIQMSAELYPGCSGGPVLNEKGEVIGVSFMAFTGAKFFNFAMPSNYLKTLLNQEKPVNAQSINQLSAQPINQEKPVKPLAQGGQSISAVTYLRWGNAKFKQEKYESAIVNYDRAIELKPDYDDAYNNRGAAKAKLGIYKSAILDFDRAIEFEPEDANTYKSRGATKAEQGAYGAAISDYDRAIELKPDYAEAYRERGVMKHKLGLYESAVLDYGKAIELKPDYAETYNGRGAAKYEQGAYGAAILDFNKAIELEPDDANTYNNRGAAKAEQGTYSAAILDFDEAIELKPDYAETYRERGVMKYKLGLYKSAILDYDKAIELKPDYTKAYRGRGIAKYRIGAYNAAILDFDAVVQIHPKDADVYVHRGVAQAMQGHIGEAKSDFQIALKLIKGSNNENLAAIIEQILEINNNEDLKVFIEKSFKNLE